MNIFAIILLVLWVICIIRGITKGLFGMIAGILSWVIFFLMVPHVTPWIETRISGETSPVRTFVEEHVDNYLEKRTNTLSVNNGSGQSSSGEEILSGLGVSLPAGLQEKAEEGVSDAASKASDSAAAMVTAVKKSLTETITNSILHGIALLAAVLLSLLIAVILGKIIRLIGKAPVIHGISRLLGAILGCVEGYLLVSLVLYLVSCFSGTEAGGSLQKQVAESSVLTFLGEHNLLEGFFSGGIPG